MNYPVYITGCFLSAFGGLGIGVGLGHHNLALLLVGACAVGLGIWICSEAMSSD